MQWQMLGTDFCTGYNVRSLLKKFFSCFIIQGSCSVKEISTAGFRVNYFKYFEIDVVNGKGTRCTLFVSGCEHACKGCYNQATWPLDAGFPFTDEVANKIISDLCDTRVRRRGLSLTGGDPLHPANVETVYQLLMRVRNECPPEKDVWLWTGYTIQELTPEQQKVADLVDVLIDGKFIESRKDRKLLWRGSSNQIIYEFDRSDAWWKKK